MSVVLAVSAMCLLLTLPGMRPFPVSVVFLFRWIVYSFGGDLGSSASLPSSNSSVCYKDHHHRALLQNISDS